MAPNTTASGLSQLSLCHALALALRPAVTKSLSAVFKRLNKRLVSGALRFARWPATKATYQSCTTRVRRLIAMNRSKCVSLALYTTPMPPHPRGFDDVARLDGSSDHSPTPLWQEKCGIPAARLILSPIPGGDSWREQPSVHLTNCWRITGDFIAAFIGNPAPFCAAGGL